MTEPSELRAEKRFWNSIWLGDGCWLWTATKNPNGYGTFWDGRKTWRAHRFAYELLVGPIPEGLQLDHLCRVRDCVNPDHLEPVTNAENTLRAYKSNGPKTHCKWGHEYTEENTIHRAINRKWRKCRECKKGEKYD